MTDIILIAIVLAILCGVVLYLLRAKRRGQTCIGCPYAKQRGSHSCSGHSHKASDQKPA